MYEYDIQSKIVREVEWFNLYTINITRYERYQLLINNHIVDQGVKEMIRIEDAKWVEYKYAYKKFGKNIHLINLKARNTFPNEVTPSLLKCYIKFNYYTMRDYDK